MSPLLLVAEAAPLGIPVEVGGSAAVKLFLLLTVLSFATAILVSITSFTRIVIVLSFLRQALGTPQLPPNPVLIALGLALSAFVMAPTGARVWDEGLGPYLDGTMEAGVAFERASAPVREFLLRHTREGDLRLFYEIAGEARPERGEAIPLSVAVPAFMVSELTTAFRMGLFLYVPLLLVDLIVAAILMSLGMMMVPPNLISLPVKIGVFLLADGWQLVVGSLARSFA